ncbi:MAG: insulinase family protein [Gammaproteobacteria bacterium]|nr:insulinase family protein [Gammaproteobacteria bacterium]
MPESVPVFLKSATAVKFLPASIQQLERESKQAVVPNSHYHKIILSNGLKIYVRPKYDIPNINIAVVVSAGKYQLSTRDEQLSPLVLKLLRQGTRKYNRSEFQKKISLLGRPMNYWQTAQFSLISAEILPQDLERTLDLLSQQLAYIKPEHDAVRKVIEQQLLENKLTQSSGSYLSKLLFYQKNYPQDHLYHHFQPESEQIKRIQKEDLMDFYRRNYRPSKSTIILSGDVDMKNIENQIKKFFSDWSLSYDNKEVDRGKQNSVPIIEDSKSYFDFIERKGSKQVDLLYGVISVPRTSSDWLPLKMIAALMGGGPSSRLFADLREQQGLSYYISARQLSGRYSSPFLIQTSVAHDKLIPAVHGINNHLNYLCHYAIEKEELELIKQQLSGEIVFKLQTNQQLVNNKLQQLENNLNDDYLYEMRNQINSTTSEQLFNVANKYLCGKHNFIAVGDSTKLEKNFKKRLNNYIYQKHYLPLH